jgi:hypothetical protein
MYVLCVFNFTPIGLYNAGLHPVHILTQYYTVPSCIAGAVQYSAVVALHQHNTAKHQRSTASSKVTGQFLLSSPAWFVPVS